MCQLFTQVIRRKQKLKLITFNIPIETGSFKVTNLAKTGRQIQLMSKLIAFSTVYNASGQPAMSIPLYWTADNIPIGIQFAAPFGDEATLFRLAAQ
ncbi:MAG: amidase family protein, partial [Candidatus Hodarchaeota archaeon]